MAYWGQPQYPPQGYQQYPHPQQQGYPNYPPQPMNQSYGGYPPQQYQQYPPQQGYPQYPNYPPQQQYPQQPYQGNPPMNPPYGGYPQQPQYPGYQPQPQQSMHQSYGTYPPQQQSITKSMGYTASSQEQQEAYKQAQKAGTLFVDHEFPANDRSLGNFDDRRKFKTITWLRPNEFMKKVNLFEDGVEPNDIEQGALGDCYVLAAIASISEYAKRIYEMIEDKGNGRYEIKMYYKGIERITVVDDLIPCSNGKPIFSKNKGNELWVMLIEKAYAKLAGSYGAIEGGSSGVALSNITGMPINSMLNVDFSKMNVFELIRKYQRKDYNMCCSIQGKGQNLIQNFGLVPGHAYTILGAYECEGHKLVKLRNPWGGVEWKGRWRDNDPNWTRNMKELVDLKDADDGIFHMAVEDFSRFFTTLNVVYFKDEWQFYQGFSVILNQKQTEIKITSVGQMIVSVLQPDEDHHVGLMMWVEDSQGNKIGGQPSQKFMETHNLKGRKVDMSQVKYGKIVLTVYGEHMKRLPLRVVVTIRSSSVVNYFPPQ